MLIKSPEEWEAVENHQHWDTGAQTVSGLNDDRQRERTISGSYATAVSLDNSSEFPTIGDQSNPKKLNAALSQPPQIARNRTTSSGNKPEYVSYVEG